MAAEVGDLHSAHECAKLEIVGRRALPWWQQVVREPLIHFFVAGLLLFALAEHHKAATDLYRIVVTPERVRQLTDGYRAEYGSTPTAHALASLIDGNIDEEVLFREGIARKLDRDDEIVRRRIVQKMQFLQQDLVAQPDPSESELEAYYQAHQARYVAPATVSFSHIYFADSAGDSEATRLRAQAALAVLSDATMRAPERGDSFPDLYDYASFGPEQARRLFGDTEISHRLFEVPAGHWVGPVRSEYGWHLVRIQSTEPGRVLPYAAVRGRVRADAISAAEAAANRRSFEALKARFTVVRADGAAGP
jgi:peptidyl-prolyl cis-trans isomerase C